MKCFALLFLAFAAPALAQTPVPVQNGNFTAPVTFANSNAGGSWESGNVPGWTIGPSTIPGTSAGIGLLTSTCGTPATQDLFTGSPTVTQDLGPAQAGTYNFAVSVCHRADGVGAAATYTISLLDGTTALCSEVGLNSSNPAGQFTTLTQSCPDTAPAAHLIVSLACSAPQCNFESVAVTFAPAVPPVIDSLTFHVGLMNCTVCSPASFTGDYTPLASASIYQGASFSLAVQNASGPNSPICSGTLNASAAASCMGGINVAPANITVIITVTNPAGAQMFAPFGFAVPSFILQAAPTGNANVLIGFDSQTAAPRAGLVWTQ